MRAALAALFGVLALSAPANAAVSHTFLANTLAIATSAADAVVVDCSGSGGDTTVNGVALATPTVPCGDVQTLTVAGDAGANTIDLSGVTAALFTSLTSRTVSGGNGNDTLTGSPLVDTINGDLNNDTIFGGDGSDFLNGGQTEDMISGGLGDDVVDGGGQNDTLLWAPGDGNDQFDGSGQDDTVQVTGDGSDEQFTITVDGSGFDIDRNAPGGEHLDLTRTERAAVIAGDGADTITGGTGLAALGVGTTLSGGDGVDTIAGTDGVDTITGGPGDDILSGADGADVAVWSAGDGDDGFDGGSGSDTARLNGDGTGETFTVAPDGSGVDIDRTAPSAAHVEADAIERVEVNAGDGADTVAGSTGLAALGVSASFSGGAGTDALTGTDGNDTLAGGADTDVITGGDGDDTTQWSAGDGSDTVHGGPGPDTAQFTGDATAETFTIAPDGSDVDVTGPSAATVDTDAVEHVSVSGGAGADTITATTGLAALGVELNLSGGNDADTITGSDGDDTLNGGSGSDDVTGGDGGDRLVFSPAATATDAIEGGAGDDTLAVDPESGNGVWTLQPDTGKIKLQRTNVTVRTGTTEHIVMSLGSGNDSLTASGELAPLGLESATINGDSGNDTIVGTDVADTIDGGASTDNIDGAGGDDTLSPGAGSGTATDTVTGGAGTDTVALDGDTSDETFTIAPDGSGVDVDRTAAVPATTAHVETESLEALIVDGGDGADTITGGTGLATLDVETTLAGGAQNDTITGTDAADVIAGDSGTDTIDGAGGADTITWNPGDGSDTVDGGEGTDRSVVNGDAGGEQFAVTPNGTRVAFGRTGTDPFTLDIGGTEQLELNAGAGNDEATAADGLGALIALTLRGDGGADTITGADGAEELSGGAGDDTVTGGAGTDTLSGDAGDDTIAARDGESDQVNCGDGADATTADAVDATTACETVSLPSESPPPPPRPPATPPAPPPPPAATPPPPPSAPAIDRTKPRIGIRTRSAVRRGIASIVVSCPRTESSCRISVLLRRGPRTIGSAKVTLAGGRSRTLRVRLDARTQRRLRTSRVLRVRCQVTGVDAAGNRSKRTVSVRLRSG